MDDNELLLISIYEAVCEPIHIVGRDEIVTRVDFSSVE